MEKSGANLVLNERKVHDTLIRICNLHTVPNPKTNGEIKLDTTIIGGQIFTYFSGACSFEVNVFINKLGYYYFWTSVYMYATLCD